MGKMPLYRVADRLMETDVPLLLGGAADDRFGRALDKLAAADTSRPLSPRPPTVLGS